MNDFQKDKPFTPCEPPPPKTTLRRLMTGILALLLSLLGLWMALDVRRYPCEHAFHHGIDSPVLAIELASDSAELRTVMVPACVDRPGLSTAYEQAEAKLTLLRNTYADCVFIPLYTLFVWSFGVLFAVREDGTPSSLRWFIAALAFTMAIADYLENVGIFRTLRTGSSDINAQLTCWPSRCKWMLFGLSMVLTAVILLRSWNPIYSIATRRLFAMAYAVIGALLIVGLWLPVLIGLSVEIFSVIVLFHMVALLGIYVADWLPGSIPKYEDDFCERRKHSSVDLAVHE